MGHRVAADATTDARVVDPVALGGQADLEIVQNTTDGDLAEGYTEGLVEERDGACATMAVAPVAAMEGVERQMVQHLGEDESSRLPTFPRVSR